MILSVLVAASPHGVPLVALRLSRCYRLPLPLSAFPPAAFYFAPKSALDYSSAMPAAKRSEVPEGSKVEQPISLLPAEYATFLADIKRQR
jgi:hypothetical protein